jgi:TonB family protein
MRVLLVDHDSEALEAIARAIRGVLELDCVTSKGDALLLLRQNTYDVLIACERCVDGSGLDLLGRTTRTTAPLKRLFAAPPDRLQLLGPRLAPFKVQRTINYPIDLEELWLAIAQVTGTSDDTDGTIERVVLDERGIPSIGTTPRAPIPATSPTRAPVPLREARPVATAPAPAPALAVASGGRAAARLTQPAPEPLPRPPRPPRQISQVRAPAPPATPSDTGRMRAPLPPATPSDTGRMRAQKIASAVVPPPAKETTSWEPPIEDDFAAVAAQARLGVQRKVVDEAARRKKQRLIVASVSAVVVAGIIVLLIEKFYDPEARARERAIAAEVSRMAEQQKVTDNLTLIEIDIEKAIMENQFDVARSELAKLVELAPDHPRREFLRSSIDRAAELARLAGQPTPAAPRPASPPERAAEPRSTERPAERVARIPDRRTAPARNMDTRRTSSTAGNSSARVYGAPLGEPIRPASIPLDAPINAPPSASPAGSPSSQSFAGRTVEASDHSQTGVVASAPAPSSQSSGSASVTSPPSMPATPAPAPVDIVPAKLVKRVTPVVSGAVPRKAEGFVVVSIEITETGRVGSVAIVESTPAGVFDEAALNAVRKWQYEPRRENGVAVASQSRARLVFQPAD